MEKQLNGIGEKFFLVFFFLWPFCDWAVRARAQWGRIVGIFERVGSTFMERFCSDSEILLSVFFSLFLCERYSKWQKGGLRLPPVMCVCV